MQLNQLVKMANDIALFFASEGSAEEAVGSVSNHLRKFWDPRMRRELLAHCAQGGTGLSDIALRAARQLEAPPSGSGQ